MTESKTVKSDLKIPKFATETEEAKWWFENDDKIFEEFKKAAKEGRLGRGGVRRLFAEKGIPFKEPKPTPTTTIRLDPEDIAKARLQAAERGLRYQTYLKMIIHEALRKEERKNSVMKKLFLTKMRDGFQIVGPAQAAGRGEGSLPSESFSSEHLLEARLRGYDFSKEQIERAMQELRNTGGAELDLPLENVA